MSHSSPCSQVLSLSCYEQGEAQKKLDVITNDVLKSALKFTGKVGVIVSGELSENCLSHVLSAVLMLCLWPMQRRRMSRCSIKTPTGSLKLQTNTASQACSVSRLALSS